VSAGITRWRKAERDPAGLRMTCVSALVLAADRIPASDLAFSRAGSRAASREERAERCPSATPRRADRQAQARNPEFSALIEEARPRLENEDKRAADDGETEQPPSPPMTSNAAEPVLTFVTADS